MEKTSKITNIVGDGSFKDLLVFELTLDNGDLGKIYRKESSPPLEVGQDITYTINDKGTIKIAFKGGGGNFSAPITNKMSKEDWAKKDELIVRQTCLKASAEFNAQSQATAQNVVEDAQYFYNWVMKQDTSKVDNSGDLPF